MGEFKLENQFIKKIEFFIKHNTFFQYTYRIVLSAFFRFLGIFVSCKRNTILFNSFFTDGSNYPYINHQIAIADIVISDYSSLLWDAALIKKPIVSFAYDYDNYASTRGLYFDMRSEFPGGVVENEQQLIERILKFNFERETQHSIALKEKFITRDSSSATNTCIEALFSK